VRPSSGQSPFFETEHGVTGHAEGARRTAELSSCATFAKIAMSLRSIMLQLSH